MRNLCKDKNKKMPRVLEDHGMNIEYLECVFKSNEMSWEMVSKFLDVYCAMYLIQDPFLSFSKREVKCYSWEKIVGFNFALKTGIIFNQFT